MRNVDEGEPTHLYGFEETPHGRNGMQRATDDLSEVLSQHVSLKVCIEYYEQPPFNNSFPSLRAYAQFLCGHRLRFRRLVSAACKASITFPGLIRYPKVATAR